MSAMLPCEYCGRMTSRDLRLCAPACCKDCGHMPLLLGGFWLVISVALLVSAIIGWRALS